MSNINNLIAERMSLIKPSPTMAVSKLAAELKAAGKDVIGLGAGEPDFDTPDHIKRAAIEAIKNGQTKYTAVDGTPKLKKAVSDKFQRDNNIKYNIDEIIISVGGKQVLFNALLSSINPGDEVIIPSPYWVSYPDMVALAGGKPIIVEGKSENNFKIMPEDIKDKISTKTKWIIINSPSNPTGSSYSKKELKNIGDLLINYKNIFIMSDDIYEKIIYDDNKFYTIAEVVPELKERILTVNGVSKAYAMTGWRMGWSVWPEELVPHVNKLIINSVSCVNAPSQFAGIAALDGPDDEIHAMMVKFNQRRKLIHEGLNNLPGVECSLPGGAFYVFPKVIGTGMNGSEFCKKAMHEAGVAIVPGSAFGKTSIDYVRFSFAASKENIEKALEKIKKMLG